MMYTLDDIILVKDKTGVRFETTDGKYKSYTDDRDFSYWEGVWTHRGYDYFFIAEEQKEDALRILNKALS